MGHTQWPDSSEWGSKLPSSGPGQFSPDSGFRQDSRGLPHEGCQHGSFIWLEAGVDIGPGNCGVCLCVAGDLSLQFGLFSILGFQRLIVLPDSSRSSVIIASYLSVELTNILSEVATGLSFLINWDNVSHSPGCPHLPYIEFLILLFPPPKCWDYRCVSPPYQVFRELGSVNLGKYFTQLTYIFSCGSTLKHKTNKNPNRNKKSGTHGGSSDSIYPSSPPPSQLE